MPSDSRATPYLTRLEQGFVGRARGVIHPVHRLIKSPTSQDLDEVLRDALPTVLGIGGPGYGTSSALDTFIGAQALSLSSATRRLTRLTLTTLTPLGLEARQAQLRELQRRRMRAGAAEVEVLVHKPTNTPSMAFLEVPAYLAKRERIDQLFTFLTDNPTTIPVVVMPATTVELEDITSFNTITDTLRASGIRALLLLSMADKVTKVSEDIPDKILEPVLAGLGIPGFPVKPWMDAFHGIFVAVTGPVTEDISLAAPEASVIDCILAAASEGPKYAPHILALRTRLGMSALWEQIVHTMEQQALVWLDTLLPEVQQRLPEVAGHLSAMPEESPSLLAVMQAARAKVDSAQLMGAIPTDLPLVNEPSLDWGNHPRSPGFTMSFSQLARHVGAGQLGVTNAQWAHNSPLLRSCLQASSGMEPDQTRPLVQCAEAAMAAAIDQVFQAPPEGATPEDRLQLSRFAGLAAGLRTIMPEVVREAAMAKLPILKAAQQVIHGDMWLNEPAQVVLRVQNSVLQLAREVAMDCVPKLFNGTTLLSYTPTFQLEEDQGHSEKRAQLTLDAQALQTAEQEIGELQAEAHTGAQAAAVAAAALLEHANAAATHSARALPTLAAAPAAEEMAAPAAAGLQTAAEAADDSAPSDGRPADTAGMGPAINANAGGAAEPDQAVDHAAEHGPMDAAAASTDQALASGVHHGLHQADLESAQSPQDGLRVPLPMGDVSASQSSASSSESGWVQI